MNNPDMRLRLCDAVEIACDHLGMPTSSEDQEAIVHAVLTALREPTDDMIRAGAEVHDYPSVYMSGPSEGGKRRARRMHAAMIEAALARPAAAEGE